MNCRHVHGDVSGPRSVPTMAVPDCGTSLHRARRATLGAAMPPIRRHIVHTPGWTCIANDVARPDNIARSLRPPNAIKPLAKTQRQEVPQSWVSACSCSPCQLKASGTPSCPNRDMGEESELGMLVALEGPRWFETDSESTAVIAIPATASQSMH